MDNKTIKILVILLVIMFGYIISIGKLAYIQIYKREYYIKYGKKIYWRSKPLIPPRGNIFDRDYENLTYNIKEKNKYTRIYPLHYHAGQIVGFVGKDYQGKSGIELKFNTQLKGTEGWIVYDKYKFFEKIKKPKQGDNIVLTIDKKIQYIADEELEKGINFTKAERGVVIISNPKTGEILAMSSYPFFDPNNPYKNLKNSKNLGISLVYEPGSVYKVIPATIALEYFYFYPNDIIPETKKGILRLYDVTIRDHEVFGRDLTFAECLVHSSNVGFALIAEKIGPKKLWEYSIDYGVGRKTGIELPGEEKGKIKNYGDKSWSKVDHLYMAIGYGVQLTPIQILTIYNTIANDGLKVRPHIIKEIRNHKNRIIKKYDTKSWEMDKIGSNLTFQRLKGMLKGVVDSGTARLAKIDGIEICGKTGTAEKYINGKYSKSAHYTTFVGFLPMKNPILSIIVVLDNPKTNQYAGRTSAVIFRNIVKRIITDPELEYYDIIYSSKLAKKNKKKYQIPDLIGKEVQEAIKILKQENIKFSLIGNGNYVVSQLPEPKLVKEKPKSIKIFLTPKNEINAEKYTPNVIGLSMREAIRILLKEGYKPIIKGSGVVIKQTPPPKTKFKKDKKIILLGSDS